MHTNPFTNTGYDLQDLRRQIEQKADRHEIYTLRGNVDSLEHTLRETRSSLDEVRSRYERLEEIVRELNPGAGL